MKNNELYIGQQFESLPELCEYIGWEYDQKHTHRILNRLKEFVSFHKLNRRTIIIDEIINPIHEMTQFIRRKENQFDYNVGDVIEINSGKAEILGQTYLITKDGKRRKAYKAKCLECGYVYTDYDHNFYKGVGCGCCNGKIVVPGINDIHTTNKQLFSLLLNKEDGYKHTGKCNKKVDFQCSICGAVHRQKSISNIAHRGLSCPCSKTKSYPNRFMFWMLTDIGIYFKDEETFEWSEGKRYDFYVPSLSMLIEMQGKQHIEESYDFTHTTLDYQIENDKKKKSLAIDNGVINYLQIDSRQSDFKFIKEKGCASELNNFFNLNDINWKWVEEKCETNIIHEIAYWWNEGIHIAKDIGKKVGLSSSPVIKYLHKCEKFGLIENYDTELVAKETINKSHDTYYQNHAKPIKCNENGLYFGNVSLTKKTMEQITGLKFSISNILGTISGKYSQHHHFTFSYISKEEFNNVKDKSPNYAFGDLFLNEKVV